MQLTAVENCDLYQKIGDALTAIPLLPSLRLALVQYHEARRIAIKNNLPTKTIDKKIDGITVDLFYLVLVPYYKKWCQDIASEKTEQTTLFDSVQSLGRLKTLTDLLCAQNKIEQLNTLYQVASPLLKVMLDKLEAALHKAKQTSAEQFQETLTTLLPALQQLFNHRQHDTVNDLFSIIHQYQQGNPTFRNIELERLYLQNNDCLLGKNQPEIIEVKSYMAALFKSITKRTQNIQRPSFISLR